MFAYGASETGIDGAPNAGAVVCEPVNLVTGPGNIYVAAAKRLLKGLIGIDAEAGPTEIVVLADDSADPEHVAADLISQAEHDVLAASVLVTDSEDLALRVEWRWRVVGSDQHTERVTVALAGRPSPASSWSTISRRASLWSTPTLLSTSRSRRAMRAGWP